MKLAFDIQRRVHRREIPPAEAFRLQAARNAGAPAVPVQVTRSRGDVSAEWLVEVPRIKASGDNFVARLLEAHETCIESRSDYTQCEKNARRTMILDLWHASEVTA